MRLFPLCVLKTILAQVLVATRFWYCAKKRSVAGPSGKIPTFGPATLLKPQEGGDLHTQLSQHCGYVRSAQLCRQTLSKTAFLKLK